MTTFGESIRIPGTLNQLLPQNIMIFPFGTSYYSLIIRTKNKFRHKNQIIKSYRIRRLRKLKFLAIVRNKEAIILFAAVFHRLLQAHLQK